MTRKNSRPPRKKNTRSRHVKDASPGRPTQKHQLNAVVVSTPRPVAALSHKTYRALTNVKCDIVGENGKYRYTVRFELETSARRALDLRPGNRIVLIACRHINRPNEDFAGEIHAKTFVPIDDGVDFPTELIQLTEVKYMVVDKPKQPGHTHQRRRRKTWGFSSDHRDNPLASWGVSAESIDWRLN